MTEVKGFGEQWSITLTPSEMEEVIQCELDHDPNVFGQAFLNEMTPSDYERIFTRIADGEDIYLKISSLIVGEFNDMLRERIKNDFDL